jgi:hypothetical protein
VCSCIALLISAHAQDALLAAANARKHLGVRAVIHTTMGDMYALLRPNVQCSSCVCARLTRRCSYLRLFGEYAPKTVENFCSHSKAGYYDGLIFHRVIKNFMSFAPSPVISNVPSDVLTPGFKPVIPWATEPAARAFGAESSRMSFTGELTSACRFALK